MTAPEGKLHVQKTEDLILQCSSCWQYSHWENSKLYIPFKFFLVLDFLISISINQSCLEKNPISLKFKCKRIILYSKNSENIQESAIGSLLIPELSSSLRIFNFTRSSQCWRIWTASSIEQLSSRMLSIASNLSPSSSVPVLWTIKKAYMNF